MDPFWNVLPLLAFLACPLMMVFCLLGMRKMGSAEPSPETQVAFQLPQERLAALQAQLQAIQAELTALEATPPPALTPVSGADRLVAEISGTAHAPQRPA